MPQVTEREKERLPEMYEDVLESPSSELPEEMLERQRQEDLAHGKGDIPELTWCDEPDPEDQL